MTLYSTHARVLVPLAFLGAAACNEKVVVKEPEATQEGEVLIGDDVDPLYIGVWAARPDLCDAEPGAVEFTENRFLGYENACDILSSEEGTDGGWRLEMRCEGEGETALETFDVDLDGESLRFSRNGGEPVTLVSCTDDDED